MKSGSTLALKAVVVLLGLIVLALCIFVLPRLIISEMVGGFDYGPIFLGMYLPAIPFFYALYQALKLLNLIDQNKAFSDLSVRALNKIKFSAIAISALYTVGLPYIFYVTQRDDAPGLVLMGLVFAFAPFIIAVLASVLQKTFQNAIDIKLENELTV